MILTPYQIPMEDMVVPIPMTVLIIHTAQEIPIRLTAPTTLTGRGGASKALIDQEFDKDTEAHDVGFASEGLLARRIQVPEFSCNNEKQPRNQCNPCQK